MAVQLPIFVVSPTSVALFVASALLFVACAVCLRSR
jgi:hypothetical protein